MKKIVISVLATMCVMGIACFGIIQNINAQHEAELVNYKDKNDVLVLELRGEYEENYELENRVDELENGIYSIMNDDAYRVDIEHNGVHHTYEKDSNGFFSEIAHIKTVVFGN